MKSVELLAQQIHLLKVIYYPKSILTKLSFYQYPQSHKERRFSSAQAFRLRIR